MPFSKKMSETSFMCGIDYADGLSILDESVSKMNELIEVLPVQGARIGLRLTSRRLSC